MSDDEPLSYFRYSLEYDGSETSVYTYTSNGVDGITIVDGDFTIDYYDKLAAFTTLESAGSGEEVKILIEAAYDSERTSSVQVKMVQDNTAPTITGFSLREIRAVVNMPIRTVLSVIPLPSQITWIWIAGIPIPMNLPGRLR